MGDKNLILFTNSYPTGSGETFLENEITFLSKGFKTITIYPLYIDKSGEREIPSNVTIGDPLLPFNPSKRVSLLINGLFNCSPLLFAIKDYFNRKAWQSAKKSWIFFSYLLTIRAILKNRKVKREILSAEKENTTLYFYWGDKSALLIPFLKRKNPNLPRCLVRFHGSDIYEEAKSFLPFRELLLPTIDIACPISQNGADYLRERYPEYLPKEIKVSRLGSTPHPYIPKIGRESFHIVSCSNVIELKRIELIAKSIEAVSSHKKIKWTHIGDGPLLDNIKKLTANFSKDIEISFLGRIESREVLKFYKESNIDLFIQLSRSEGIPVSIMEAISFGIPVIATNVGGVNEIVSNSIGRLLPANPTVSEVKKELEYFISISNSGIFRFKENARNEWSKRWNMEKNYSDFVNLTLRQP